MGHGMRKIAAITSALILILSIAGSDGQEEAPELTKLGTSKLYISKRDADPTNPKYAVEYGKVEAICEAAKKTSKLSEADLTAFKALCEADQKGEATTELHATDIWYILASATAPDLTKPDAACPIFSTATSCGDPSSTTHPCLTGKFRYICAEPPPTSPEAGVGGDDQTMIDDNKNEPGNGTANEGAAVAINPLLTKSLIVTTLLFSAAALGLHF